MKQFFIAAVFACFCVCSFAQEINVYPMHWWAGMKNPNLQLMVHSPNIGERLPMLKISAAGIKMAEGITLKKINRVDNQNYVFLDLVIDKSARPGKRAFNFGTGENKVTIDFEIKPRREGKGKTFAQGVTAADFIYLLMPDRFSNGDKRNDRIAGLRDQTLNRDSVFHRHGGDLQGVINHLDYLNDLGVTTVWMTPVLQNDMPDRTEHGYAFTNHYTIEPRLGGEVAYKNLSDALHKRGMKLIQDAVYNHVGLYHFTVQDKPMKDWLNEWPSYTQTTYKDQSLMDMYGAEQDRKLMSDGWFTRMMPDLNQRNPFVANYLIQHALFSVEEFGVDGWRIDTYPYNDLNFMNRCNKALLDEYPSITMFGETWVHGVLNQAYFTENNLNIPFKSNLPGVTDFQTNMYGIGAAVNENFGWTEGVNKLYSTLVKDFVYKNPMRNVIFLDNHDKARWYTQVGENVNKHKIGLGWLLTGRGIPQMYYGTEIIMAGSTSPNDGFVRFDFPGGWEEDKQNKFTTSGRTAQEQEVFEWTKKLANFRKSSSAIKSGKLLQFVPQDGLYVYFRYDNNQTVMCVMNTNDKELTVDFNKYAEAYKNFTKAKSVTSESEFSLKSTWPLGGKQMWVMELE